MAQDNDQSQKTEQPTAQKLSKAVTEGDVLQSRELMTALAMLAGTFWLAGAGGWMMDACRQLLVKGLTFSRAEIDDFTPQSTLIHELAGLAMPMLLLFAATLLASIGGTAALGSLGWRNKGFMFKASRLSPLAGVKRMFGTHALAELGKALAKVLLLGAIGYYVLA
jgi:flagellar biosynthesis protein FlhB